jgi:hypothetical protein
VKFGEDAGAQKATQPPEASTEQIEIQEVPGIEPRPRHLPEIVAAVALARVAAEDPDPLRALERVAKYATAFLVRNGVR